MPTLYLITNDPQRMTHKLSLTAITLIVAALTVFGSGIQKSAPPTLLSLEPVMAQAIRRPQDVWRQVYQQLPDIPLENQYVNKTSGKVDADNTLVSRLIRYHMFVKGRPPNFRLDWKLTLADYLGANELMEEGVYPGGDTLRENPMESDRTAIGRLTRTQRNALVQALVNIFNPNAEEEAAPAPRTTQQPETNPTPEPTTPRLPQPGDAQQLRL
jgi:hypothetical protein